MYKSSTHSSLPFLTTQFDGTGGTIKTYEEDFFVEEIPSYIPCGEGTHIYAQIEKNGISTMDALVQIANALRITRKEIGYAGLKDAHAVTRQWISIEHIKPERLLSLDIPNIKIIQIARHYNKLKLGHLARNRFVIRLRNLKFPLKQSVKIAERIIAVLIRKGVPNYFGGQRFGIRSDTHLLGEAISKVKIEEFVDIFLGQPAIDESSTFAVARSFYERGDYKKALNTWPYSYSNQRRALKALIVNKGNKKKAYNIIDKHLKRFFVSAYQSDLFNQVLAARMPGIDKLFVGDMAYKHINGACFRVDDAVLEQPRCDVFEISPTGPLLGSHMTRLTGPAGDIENSVLNTAGLESGDFQQMSKYGGRGGRRPLRFRPHHPKVTTSQDKLGPYIELQFELDSGCYATSFIREISKTNL
ncbi:MAG: tRNA pseudouridine(13) synthase TruD [Planctomycetes bacterium]|nr:tRNA pseudouridine(13) synthase TruD [Planctomycetota bacterium]MBL7143209.1 tRNA pseudouridine(13) synthase TruD [Phycisphaerae bacterium]